MRKTLIIILAFVLVFSLAACGNKDNNVGQATKPVETIEPSINENNTIQKETEPVETENQTTEPVAEPTEPWAGVATPVNSVDIAKLSDGVYHIEIKDGDIYNTSAENEIRLSMNATIYEYDKYDGYDLSRLEVGNTIIINGQEIVINDIDTTKMGGFLINGGQAAENGYELFTDIEGMYYVANTQEQKEYIMVGTVTLPLSSDFQYVVYNEAEDSERIYGVADFTVNDIVFSYEGQPETTTIVVESGTVTSMATRN